MPATPSKPVGIKYSQRLQRLRERFISLNLRSRSLRLYRSTKSGAFDLFRLQQMQPGVFHTLVHKLGRHNDAHIDLLALHPTDPEQAQLAKDIATLAHRSHAAWLETGIADLAVGWPILEGKTADGTWLRGPLLVYPATLVPIRSGRHRWSLHLEGLPELNETLAQTLSRLCSISLTLDELLEDDDDRVFAVDSGTWGAFGKCLRRLQLPLLEHPEQLPPLTALAPRSAEQRQAAAKGQFRLNNHLILGRFPASASAIVGDYEELLQPGPQQVGLAADLLKLDEAFAQDDQSEAQQTPEPNGTGPSISEMRSWLVLQSDSSQDRVLRWLGQNRSRGLVVQGPPGTGKSQLIANLVAACIKTGQRALLVCQKRVALDVVADRLRQEGLGEPIALVHNTQRDRSSVMSAIAHSIESCRNDRQSAQRENEFELAHTTLESRLVVADQAFAWVAQGTDRRPSLAQLNELALEDDGRPLPDLTPLTEQASQQELLAFLPRVEIWSERTPKLAKPHPLHIREDWSRRTQDWIDNSFADMRMLYDLLQQVLPSGPLTPQQALQNMPLWQGHPDLFDLLQVEDIQEARRFQLFWGWTGGASDQGQWHTLMQRLKQARQDFRPVPFELIRATRQTVETWIAELTELKQLSTRWYRFFSPRWWSLRKLPGQILDLCASWQPQEQPRQTNSLAPDLIKLCEQALQWQQLIADMPTEHPFVDFGFQGQLEDIDRTLQGLQLHHRRVTSVHQLQEQLREQPLSDRAKVYQALPTVADLELELREVPFFRGIVADSRCATALQAVHRHLESCHKLDTGFRKLVQAAVTATEQGENAESLAQLRAVLDSAGDKNTALQLDQLVAEAPDWIKLFLRLWSPCKRSQVDRDLRQALHRAWVANIVGDRDPTMLEAPLVDSSNIQALTQSLDACRQLAHGNIQRCWRQRFRSCLDDKNMGPQIRKLQHEAKKQRRRLTLRQLVSRFWDSGLAVARPIWFSSPETVAAMFPLATDLFDLVIFDEASQCPVEAGIPILVRGKRTLIAGDDQQMPPSHFFQASEEEDEDDEESSVLSSQSMLDLARIAYESTTLRWHYRSLHESLVAFSNHVYYGGQLLTAPSTAVPQATVPQATVPQATDPQTSGLESTGLQLAPNQSNAATAPMVDIGVGLHWCQVPGLWQKQTNLPEAQRTVQLVKQVLGQRQPRLSLGIVTFNLPQADLIEELLDAEAAEDSAFAALLDADRKRPPMDQLFIRNLENVQGDERDVIAFSVGYGPGEPGGKVAARFGPLGQQGGEKRLNVAITRARRAICVLCSFDPSELDVTGSKRVGPKLLQAYLRFVQQMSRGQLQQAHDGLTVATQLAMAAGKVASRSPLVIPRVGRKVRAQLAERLQQAGLEVATDFGLSEGRIDLAVRAKGEENYALGIDCGAFLSEPNALVRDVYTPRFWQRFGWRILRVTPGSWVRDPEAVVQTVKEMLAIRQTAPTPKDERLRPAGQTPQPSG